MWLEHLARARGAAADRIDLPCEFTRTEIDWRDTLAAVIDARLRGVAPAIIARAFHRSLARAIADASVALAGQANVDTVVLSGGVMQNDLLLGDVRNAISDPSIRLWVNHTMPANDGSVSLGQAALAACRSVRTENWLRTENAELRFSTISSEFSVQAAFFSSLLKRQAESDLSRSRRCDARNLAEVGRHDVQDRVVVLRPVENVE